MAFFFAYGMFGTGRKEVGHGGLHRPIRPNRHPGQWDQ